MSWYREVTTDQWRAFWAAYLGWLLDGFDFTIMTFLLVDIQRSFGVNNTLAGALLTASALFRVVGGAGAGSAADRWGRKAPLMVSILWYSVFTFLSGFSTTYTVLIACRALFGIGMGGVWAAGMPLALEHWPAHLRGLASGMLQSGYAMGYILSALVYQYVYPMVSARADFGWRVMLWIGILPAFLVIWIMWRVKESPIWLERQLAVSRDPRSASSTFGRLFAPDLLPVTLQAMLLMAGLLFMYNSMTYWYPTLLGELNRRPLPFAVAFNLGGTTGTIAIGRLSETALGRRGAAGLATVIGIASIPLYLFASNTAVLLIGAFLIGFFGSGNFGVIPGYLSERFPTAVRATGAGFTYQAGAAIAAAAPTLIGALRDGGMARATAMSLGIAGAGMVVLLLLSLGPETRGRELRSET
jgi:MFS transporter, SHS family, lactate transporter